MFKNIQDVQNSLREHLYVADRGLSTVIYLASKLGKPLFLEGEPGVGKTEVAKVLSSIHNTQLIRLQCYEGLDVHNAVYEWTYNAEALYTSLLRAGSKGRAIKQLGLYGSHSRKIN